MPTKRTKKQALAVTTFWVFLFAAIGLAQDQRQTEPPPTLQQQLPSPSAQDGSPPYENPLLRRPPVDEKMSGRQSSNKGIHVGQPKVFDDRSLQIMLQAAEQRLAALQAIDQARITANVGAIQGGSQVENGLGVQVGTLPTSSIVTNSGTSDSLTTGLTQGLSTGTANNVGSTVVSGNNPSTTGTASNGTTSNGSSTASSSSTSGTTGSTQTSTPSVTPAFVPAPPQSGLSLPTNVSVSASDVLNEEMQLTFEIANLRMLLQGSLNDRFITGNQRIKQHATIGFPISIEPPTDGRYAGAVAEVRVTITTWPDFFDKEENKPVEWKKNLAPLMQQLNLSRGNYPEGSFILANFPTRHKIANDRSELYRKTETFVGSEEAADGVQTKFCPAYFGSIPVQSRGNFSDRACPEAPGLMAILPREKTYNVVDIRGNSVSLAGAVTAKVLSAGVTWYHATKHFYIRQAQDTVAFEDVARLPSDRAALNEVSTTFGWQFRPVLNEKHVRAGLRQLFAELSFPTLPPPKGKWYGTVTIETRWRKYKQADGSVGDAITDSGFEQSEVNRVKKNVVTWVLKDTAVPSTEWVGAWQIPNFNLTPNQPRDLTWEDAGNGLVSVTARNFYSPGTSVILGSTIVGPGTANYFYDPEKLRFVASAADLVRVEKPFLEEQGGRQSDLQQSQSDQPQLTIVSATSRPFNNQESVVTLCYSGGVPDEPSMIATRPLALLGNSVYGLSDHPYIKPTENPCSDRENAFFTFRAQSDLVRSARKVRLKQLFRGPKSQAEREIDIKNDFGAAKAVAVAAANKCTLLAVQGSDLLVTRAGGASPIHVRIGDQEIALLDSNNKLRCRFTPDSTDTVKGKLETRSTCSPQQAYLDTTLGLTTLLIAAPDCLLKTVKQLEIYRGDSSSPSETQPVLLPVTEEKPALAQIETIEVPVGTKLIHLRGSHLELVDLTSLYFTGFVGAPLNPKSSADRSYIDISLPDSLASTTGNYALNFVQNDKDKTVAGALVRVVKSKTQ